MQSIAHFAESVLNACQSFAVGAGLASVRNALGEPLDLCLDGLDGATRHRLIECATNLAKLQTERPNCFFRAGPVQCFDLVGDPGQLPLEAREVLSKNRRWRWGLRWGVWNRLLRLLRHCFTVERTRARRDFGDRVGEGGRKSILSRLRH